MSRACDDCRVDDQRVGAVIRALRLRRGWRQTDLARAAGVSHASVSRAEAGLVADLPRLREIARPLDLRLDVVPRWRGGDLDRLLNARHSAMHEAVARDFAGLVGWTSLAEVSFAFGMERGIVDVLAWHAATRSLLVVELKTELVDVQEMLGTLDRKVRLAPRIGRERGWPPARVGTWVLLAESTRNRVHVQAHQAVLAGRFPAGPLEMRRWLVAPTGTISALTFLRPETAGAARSVHPGGRRLGRGRAGELRRVQPVNVTHAFAPRKRVRLSSQPPGGEAGA